MMEDQMIIFDREKVKNGKKNAKVVTKRERSDTV
jgi:hypothetical protein